MHIHILGICGTFMGGLALIARSLGYRVTGSDQNVYPPMSDQLREQGIDVWEGYDPTHLDPLPDCVIIGNALSRGNSVVEYVLDQGINYTSGPQWLAENVLRERWVIAVAGTHGKTTTASMLAWILDQAGLNPGFLVGGIASDLGVSARLGDTPFFVIEADEYDSAFFDKRSKFVHYRPRTLVTNNLEFDHADIFPNLDAIKRQFHHLLRTLPSSGLLIAPSADLNLKEVVEMGCWTRVESIGFEMQTSQGLSWRIGNIQPDGAVFDLTADNGWTGQISWSQSGRHNMLNALAAVAAARHAGVPPQIAVEALSKFAGVKRRMEKFNEANGISFFDDFAHHPTAIQLTLEGLRARVGAAARIVVLLELRSNSMRMGIHNQQLAASLQTADLAFILRTPDLEAPIGTAERGVSDCHIELSESVEDMVCTVRDRCLAGDQVVVMSNGAFGGIYQKLISAFEGVN